MTAHIYREGGSWWSTQRDPSGGEIRCRYPNGRAAMIALDPRNREMARKPRLECMRELIEAGNRAFARTQAYTCAPSAPTTKDCE